MMNISKTLKSSLSLIFVAFQLIVLTQSLIASEEDIEKVSSTSSIKNKKDSSGKDSSSKIEIEEENNQNLQKQDSSKKSSSDKNEEVNSNLHSEKISNEKEKPAESKKSFAKFYVFDVGQGNCQFIVYPEEKIGFLYDAGSASTKKHLKFIKMAGVKKNQVLNFEKDEKKPQENDMFEGVELSENDDSEYNSTDNKSISDITNQSQQSAFIFKDSQSVSNNENNAGNIINIKKNLKEIIKQSEIDLLFVFLSHPDKDHINFFSTVKKGESDTLPESDNDILPDNNIKIMVFACGRFISNESQDVKNFIKYFNEKKKKNDKIEMIFPYTWGNSTEEEFLKMISRESEEDLIQQNFHDFIEKNISQKHTQLFEKNIGISQTLKVGNEEKINKKNVKESFFSEEDIKNIKKLKDRVFIWGMNYRDNDVNAQSTVMSFKLSPDTSLTVTGDAEPVTLKAIGNKAKTENLTVDEILGINRILVIPHHGAEDNISEEIITFFNPDIALISAANGKQFGHPHKKVIRWLQSEMNKKEKRFAIVGGSQNTVLSFGTYDKNENNIKNKYYLKSLKTDKTKEISRTQKIGNIFSTNICGNISFDDDKMYTSFSSIYEYEKEELVKIFEIDFSKSLSDDMTKKIMKEVKEEQDDVIIYEDKFYFLVKEEKDKPHNKFYKMRLLEEYTKESEEDSKLEIK